MHNNNDNDLPKFHFIIGCENMEKDKILCATHENSQIFQMHQITVPPLTDISEEGKNLVERWKVRDKEGGTNRFIAYIEKNGKVCSMVSGRIVQQEAVVINTATRPEFRKKGYYKAVLANLVKELKNNHKDINFITASISSRTQLKERISDKLLEEINNLSNTIEFDDVEDEKSKTYGKIIGKSVYASKKIGESNENAKAFYNKLPDNPPYNNLASQKAMLEHAIKGGANVEAKIVKFESPIEKDLIFTPKVSIKDNNIYDYATEAVDKFNKDRKQSLEKKKQFSLQENNKKSDCITF